MASKYRGTQPVKAIKRPGIHPKILLDPVRRKLAVGIFSLLGMVLLFLVVVGKPLFSELRYTLFSSLGSGSSTYSGTRNDGRPAGFSNVGKGSTKSPLFDSLREQNKTRPAPSSDFAYLERNTPAPQRERYASARRYGRPTAVDITSFRATRAADQISIEWLSAQEIGTLGFHIYRNVGGKKVRLTDAIISAKSLESGNGSAIGTGYKYEYVDKFPPVGQLVYELEIVGLDNSTRKHSLVVVSKHQ